LAILTCGRPTLDWNMYRRGMNPGNAGDAYMEILKPAAKKPQFRGTLNALDVFGGVPEKYPKLWVVFWVGDTGNCAHRDAVGDEDALFT